MEKVHWCVLLRLLALHGGPVSLGLLSDLTSLHHFLGQVFHSLIHKLLLAILFELLRQAVLMSSLLSKLFPHNLSPLLSRNLLLSICQLFLTYFCLLLILPLKLLKVVLLVGSLDFHNFLSLDPRLLNLLQNALLFIFEQSDSIFDLYFIVGQVLQPRVDIEHALVLLSWLVRNWVSVVNWLRHVHYFLPIWFTLISTEAYATRIIGVVLVDKVLVSHNHLIGQFLGLSPILHHFRVVMQASCHCL